jgi:two-component sensor histidine kinase
MQFYTDQIDDSNNQTEINLALKQNNDTGIALVQRRIKLQKKIIESVLNIRRRKIKPKKGQTVFSRVHDDLVPY